MVVEALTLLMLFIIGYTALRTSICMLAAVQEVVHQRRANRLTGFLLAAACSALAMAVSMFVGSDPFTTIPGYPAGLAAIAGGAIFAVGATINGRCALGTLAALASGDIRHIATLVGMIGAALVATPLVRDAIGTMGAPPATPSLLAEASAATIAAGATVLVLFLSLALRHSMKRASEPQLWSPLLAMILIGTASGLLFAFDKQWPYTSLIEAFAMGNAAQAPQRVAHVAVLFAAMVVGAASAGLVRIERGTAQKWTGAIVGGLLMGLGASFVPGGNDVMLMTGVPLLLPNLILAYASLIVTLFAIEWVRTRRAA